MTTTDTPQMKLAAKNSALHKLRTKRENLAAQIAVFEKSLARIDEDIAKQEDELTKIQNLLGEHETLDKELTVVMKKISVIVEKFEQYEWRPNMPHEETIASDKDYPVLLAQKNGIIARMGEIPKEVNKVYYRR